MLVAETLRNRKNFSIVLWIKHGLNIFVIQQFFSGKGGRETSTGKRVKKSGSGRNICRPEN
jgi:hypothetical protein